MNRTDPLKLALAQMQPLELYAILFLAIVGFICMCLMLMETFTTSDDSEEKEETEEKLTLYASVTVLGKNIEQMKDPEGDKKEPATWSYVILRVSTRDGEKLIEPEDEYLTTLNVGDTIAILALGEESEDGTFPVRAYQLT